MSDTAAVFHPAVVAERAGCHCSKWQEAQEEKQLEPIGNTWACNGCCGGGCFVLSGLIFCPWCGTKLNPAYILDQGASFDRA